MGREGNNIRGGIRRIQLKGDRRRKIVGKQYKVVQGENSVGKDIERIRFNVTKGSTVEG